MTKEAGDNKYYCKRSDLPIYTPVVSNAKHDHGAHTERTSFVQQSLESGIRTVRTELQSGIAVLSKQTEQLTDLYETGKAHTQSTIDYLNEPHNVLPRSGAIAIGGLAGLIFAARGGFIKKILYTSIGASAIASLCYPQQAEFYARETLYEARKGFAITYNFVKGVKPGEEVPIEPIKRFPTSLQDIKFIFLDLYDEAKENFFPSKKD